MDFPMAPHKLRGNNKDMRQGEDVVVYDGGIKNVHQDFVIVFAITFAVIVILIVTAVVIYHSIKKFNRFLVSRKQVPNLCVTTEAGTVIYEREPSLSSLHLDTAAAGLQDINEIRSSEDLGPASLSSRERRRRFAENKSKTSYASSYSPVTSTERCESCSCGSQSRAGSGHLYGSSSKDLHQWLGASSKELQGSGSRLQGSGPSRELGLHLDIVDVSGSRREGRRHTCTLESQRGRSSLEQKVERADIRKQHSLQC